MSDTTFESRGLVVFRNGHATVTTDQMREEIDVEVCAKGFVNQYTLTATRSTAIALSAGYLALLQEKRTRTILRWVVPDLVNKLQACVDDPMWADHAEISKALLRRVIDKLNEL